MERHSAEDAELQRRPLLSRRRTSKDTKDTNLPPLAWFAIALVRGMVGPAALYMPNGFRSAGVAGGIVTVLVANVLFFLGIDRLIACWEKSCAPSSGEEASVPREEEDQRRDEQISTPPNKVVTATDVARKLGGDKAAMVSTFCICTLQLGTCVTYFIFFAEALAEAAPGMVSKGRVPLLIAAMAALEASVAASDAGDVVEKLRGANFAGNVLVGASLIAIATAKALKLMRQGSGCEVTWGAPSVSGVALFGGTAVFAFEGGAAVLVPAANQVPLSSRSRVASVACGVVLCIALCYTAFGLIVYVADGKATPVVASLALRRGSVLSSAVNASYACVALLTFPLQLLPATQILFPPRVAGNGDDLDDSDAALLAAALPDASPSSASASNGPLTSTDAAATTGDKAKALSRDNVLRRRLSETGWRRAVLVLCLAALALAFRHRLDHVVALLGAVSTAPFALVLGPLLHAKAVARSTFDVVFDLALAVLGAALTVATTALTIRSWSSGRS